MSSVTVPSAPRRTTAARPTAGESDIDSRYICTYRYSDWQNPGLPLAYPYSGSTPPKSTTAGGSRRRSSASGSRPKPSRSPRGSRAALASMPRSALQRGYCGTPPLYMVASPTRGASGRAQGRGQPRSCSIQRGKSRAARRSSWQPQLAAAAPHLRVSVLRCTQTSITGSSRAARVMRAHAALELRVLSRLARCMGGDVRRGRVPRSPAS